MLEPEEGRGERGHQGGSGHGHEECARNVTIVVDNQDVHLHRGRYDLGVIKQLAKVPESDDLDQLVGTKLVALPNDKPLEILRCEIFASHPKSGGSS